MKLIWAPLAIDRIAEIASCIARDNPSAAENMTPTTIIQCPYCWQELEIAVDTSAGSQSYIEDCQVCCRPMLIRVEIEDGEVLSASAEM